MPYFAKRKRLSKRRSCEHKMLKAMATIPGGPSDKLGNEYERLWTVRHLLHVLAGRAASIEIEPLGDDERGAEFWVSRPASGMREAHQCKRENGSRGIWSVADLAAKKVIANALFQLERDPAHRFVFASGDKAPLLSDLAERAKQYGADPDQFYRHAVPTSADHKREFASLCRQLELDPNKPEELKRIIGFLQRFTPVVDDKTRQRSDVELLAELLVAGDPKTVVTVLEGLASESVGKTVRESEITERLRAHGLAPRDLTKDLTLSGKIADLRDRFKRSYRDLLIAGKTLDRPETTELHRLLTSPGGPRLMLLHGAGGDGKSGVAFELVAKLDEESIPYLPLRLDRDRPADTPNEYGQQLGLPASPVACSAAVADCRPAILILDQIDAVRWTSAHSAHAWDTCERIISECLRNLNLRVLAICRTFDVDDDTRIRAWKEREHASELKVGLLDDSTVDRVIAACGLAPSTLDQQQRRVLRSPQALYLWRELYNAGERPSFRTLTDLMRSFWSFTRKKLKELKPGEYQKVIDVLVEDMDRHGTVSSPATTVSSWPDEVDALRSLNVLAAGDHDRVLFAHQSYVDHLTAEKVLREIRSGGKTISAWLRDDDQSLFRRGQLRQLLTLLRDEDPKKYVEALYDLLTSNDIRFHLQHLALQMLGQADPPLEAEVQLVLGLLDDPKMIDHVYGQVLIGREPWFDAIQSRGVLRRWLDGTDERFINLAINLIERLVESRGADAEALLLGRKGKAWDKRLENVLWRSEPWLLSAGLFDVFLQHVRQGSAAMQFVRWRQLATSTFSSRAILLLDARQEHVCDVIGQRLRGEKQPFAPGPDATNKEEIKAVSDAGAANPQLTWDTLMTRLIQVEELAKEAAHALSSGPAGDALFLIFAVDSRRTGVCW